VSNTHFPSRYAHGARAVIARNVHAPVVHVESTAMDRARDRNMAIVHVDHTAADVTIDDEVTVRDTEGPCCHAVSNLVLAAARSDDCIDVVHTSVHDESTVADVVEGISSSDLSVSMGSKGAVDACIGRDVMSLRIDCHLVVSRAVQSCTELIRYDRRVVTARLVSYSGLWGRST
jgi:hypothetical protein